MTTDEILSRVEAGRRLSAAEALALADRSDLQSLMTVAAALRDGAHGDLVSYSRKVFIPLTQLCRDVCHYCTFAHPPRAGEPENRVSILKQRPPNQSRLSRTNHNSREKAQKTQKEFTEGH